MLTTYVCVNVGGCVCVRVCSMYVGGHLIGSDLSLKGKSDSNV